MKLINLNLRNFKGIKDLNLELKGQDLNIYGENGSGKTTIFDAFMWLLFDKDSQNSSQFNVKPLDKAGEQQHMLEHEVSATIEHEGKEIQMQKIYKEKWTKKRGQADSELTGHTTDFFINGVPKKLKEYKDFLAEIIDEDTFKIITNPLHFNNKIDWKKRRQIALEICGEAEIEEIFNKNSKLLELKDILVDKSIEDIKAEMAAKRRKLNEELNSIPYRIDELSRASDIDNDIKDLLESKKALENEINDLKTSKAADYDFRIRNIEGGIKVFKNQLIELEQNAAKDVKEKINNLLDLISAVKRTYNKDLDELEKIKRNENNLSSQIQDLDEKIIGLRNEAFEINGLQFDKSSNTCPTCKQELPEEQIKNHKDEFCKDKENKLQQIKMKGKSLSEQKKIYEDELIALHDQKKDLEQVIVSLKNDIDSKQSTIDNLQDDLKNIDIKSSKEYLDVLEKIESKQQEIKELTEIKIKNDNTKKLEELNSKLSEIDELIARIKLIENNNIRKEELKNRERELSNMIAELEKKEFLCDQFIITKSDLLEEKLNSKFKLVKFKLFDKQINGGINETFITTVEGVPFEDLNNAMKINAGLDIINTLTEYYRFEAPIFIDNRESVNEILDIKSQVINLVVTKDEKLRFEIIDNREVA